MASSRARASPAAPSVTIPTDANDCTLEVAPGQRVRLTNLRKLFWPELGVTKGDLLRYYARIAPTLLVHLRDRAMVMKRYPHGWDGPFFFMKRAPPSRPSFLRTCTILHESGSRIRFPVVDDLASLLWLVNLGCIDLNPWYARCADTNRPDYLHFDLDPVPGASFERVIEAALLVHAALLRLRMPSYVKTSGSRGLHVFVPIVLGPTQKEVWSFTKRFALELAARHRTTLTTEYRVAARPRGRVLVDYNQNARGRTLASVYSVRPRRVASVSTPVTWRELERGVRIEDYRIDNVPTRIENKGDLWAALAPEASGRFDLRRVL